MTDSVSRVEKEFIFAFLIKNKVMIEIKCGNKSLDALFLEQSHKEIKVQLFSICDEIKSYESKVKVMFFFQNAQHIFNSIVLKIQGNIALIANPETVARNLLRKFERVYINGKIKVRFELEGEILPLNYPVSKTHYYPEKPPVHADFQGISIDELLKRFKERMSYLVSTSKIQMMRNFTPQSFFEKMAICYGKTLVIPNTRGILPTKQISQNYEILLRNNWVDYEMVHNLTNPGMVNRAISEYLFLLSKSGIYSFAIVPILYKNYTIGIITMANTIQKSAEINNRILDYTTQFARVMSYTLKKNGYFKAETGEKVKYELPIHDLSPGGMALWLENDIFQEKFRIDENIDFVLEINGREIKVMGKLVRKFEKLAKYFYGFVFLGIKTDDYEFLNKYLYNSEE
jgi:hypothetical protein